MFLFAIVCLGGLLHCLHDSSQDSGWWANEAAAGDPRGKSEAKGNEWCDVENVQMFKCIIKAMFESLQL